MFLQRTGGDATKSDEIVPLPLNQDEGIWKSRIWRKFLNSITPHLLENCTNKIPPSIRTNKTHCISAFALSKSAIVVNSIPQG